jgi:hypothetical protein
LSRLRGQPVAERFARREDVGLGQGAGRRRVTASHCLEECSVFAHTALFLLGEELEEVARHDPDRLAQVGEEPGRAGGEVQRPVEASVGDDDVVGPLNGAGQLGKLGQFGRGDAGCRHLGGLTSQGGQDSEVVDGVLRRDADHGHAAARRDLDQALVGKLEQGLSYGGPADPELGGQVVQVQAVTRLEPSGEDPVAQFVGRLGPDGGRDEFDI